MKYSKLWDATFKRMKKSHLETNIARYKADENLKLLKKWCDNLKNKKILKTDLFEECYKRDQFSDKIRCKNIYGIDVSKKITINSKKRNKNLIHLVSDICHLPFKDEKFDVVISNSTLDHIKVKDVPKAIGEIKRVLKDNGILILTIDNKHNPLYTIGLFLGNRLNLLPFHQERCYTVKEVKRLINDKNLKVVDEDVIFNLIPPLDIFLAFLEKYNKDISLKLSCTIVRFSKRLNSKYIKYLVGRQLAFKIKKRV